MLMSSVKTKKVRGDNLCSAINNIIENSERKNEKKKTQIKAVIQLK